MADKAVNYRPLTLRQFICVDLDRTILRSTSLFDSYVLPGLKQLADQRADGAVHRQQQLQIIDSLQRDMVENIGKSFDFLAVYNERADLAERLSAEDLARQVIAELSDGALIDDRTLDTILAPSALSVLSSIDQLSDSDWGILTSGGVQTQTLKLLVLEWIIQQRLGLKLAAQIISTEHKTRDVDLVWRLSDGRFKIPPDLVAGADVVAEQVVLIDDKAKNLEADDLTGITTILVEQLEMPVDGLGRVSLVEAAKTLT